MNQLYDAIQYYIDEMMKKEMKKYLFNHNVWRNGWFLKCISELLMLKSYFLDPEKLSRD